MGNISDLLTQEELDYLVNLVESEEKKDWNKAVNDLNAEMHPDSLRKSFNVGKYSGYSVYKYMQDKIENNLLSDEEAIRLEKLRDKEYKERVKLQDANREKRKYLRDFSRVETIMEYIDKKLEEREPISFSSCTTVIPNGNEASALISDLHAGATVNSIFNYYDLDVLKDRMNELADKIIAFCKRDNVSHLNAEFLGDFITGIIHGSTIAQAQEDVIDQVFAACDVIEAFIVKLRKEIPSVRVFVEYGNHGRVQKGKSDGANKENFERIVAPYIRKDLRNTDIEVIDGGYEDFIAYKLKDGKVIVVTHGTNDNMANANQTFTKLLGVDVYEVHMGHLHNPMEGNGATVNGSVMGSDDYSISIRKHQKPTQILKVYYGDDVATYKLTLK